ncbi:MAG: hypothetical protein ACK4OM_03760 [Alphaproteobacteria bacterium]
MVNYPVKYLQYDNQNTSQYDYFDFSKAVRVADIDGIYYTVKYHTDIPQERGPFGHPYIDFKGEEYPVHCKGEIQNREIILNGETIDYQAVNQICYVEIL